MLIIQILNKKLKKERKKNLLFISIQIVVLKETDQDKSRPDPQYCLLSQLISPPPPPPGADSPEVGGGGWPAGVQRGEEYHGQRLHAPGDPRQPYSHLGCASAFIFCGSGSSCSSQCGSGSSLTKLVRDAPDMDWLDNPASFDGRIPDMATGYPARYPVIRPDIRLSKQPDIRLNMQLQKNF